MRPPRTMTRASYAPANDPEYVKQAVAHQVVENRASRVNGTPEVGTPVLGKDAATTQGLREHAAATTLQNAFRARSARRERQAGLGMAATLNAMASSPRVEAYKDALRDTLPTFGRKEVMNRERAHAAAMVMPNPATQSLAVVREDSQFTVLGHGAPGQAILGGTPGNTIALSQVAQDLRQGGLHEDQVNVRMSSCASADALPRAAFSPNVPDRERAPGMLPAFLRPMREAPAKTFVNELQAQGFRQPSVTGYQGNGVQNPSGIVAERQLGHDAATRRSEVTVAHHFFPD